MATLALMADSEVDFSRKEAVSISFGVKGYL
jgi:hypothetical protein